MNMPKRSEYPDPLIPLDAPKLGEPLSIPVDQNVPIWIDVHVPVGTAPDVYSGTVTVTDEAGGSRSIPIELTVWPFTLTDAPSIPCLVGVDHRELLRYHLRHNGKPHAPNRLSAQDPQFASAQTLIEQSLRLFRDHRCSPFLSQLRPAIKILELGTVNLDWTDYDRIAAGFLNGTAFRQNAPVEAWPLPIDRDFPNPPTFGGVGSPSYVATLRSHLRACLAHFEEKGWLDHHFVSMTPPDVGLNDHYDLAEHFGRVIRYCDERLKFMTHVIPQDMAPWGWDGFQYNDEVTQYVRTWCPDAQFFFPQPMAQQRANGKQTWMRPGVPPFSSSLHLEAPPWQARALLWQAARVGAEALYIAKGNDWYANLGDNLADPSLNHADWLIYPGSICGLGQPIPSIRLKMLRRGLQDIQYHDLLRRFGVPRPADLITGHLIKAAAAQAYNQHFAEAAGDLWVDDPALWAASRGLMAREISRLASGRENDSELPIQKTIEWAQFFQKTRDVVIEVDPPRIRRAGPDAPGMVDVEFPVTITNYLPEPIDGELRLMGAAAGVDTDPVPVSTIPSFGRIRVPIIARVAGVGWNGNGTFYQPIEFASQQAGKVEIIARVAVMAAHFLRKPIVVDGQLEDWPKLDTNVAGDFVLAGRGKLADVQTDARGDQPTLAFVTRDANNLYVAFNGVDQTPATGSQRNSNFVRYDGLTPVGEDIIEIMLDPTNSGTSNTADMYHIVVKPTGTVISEIGLPASPPTGKRQYWPVDIRLGSTRTPDDRWLAELRIPLDAFPAGALDNPYWGFNVARFQASRNEYASWSGARRHFYCPRSMGNLSMVGP
jgi:hypothetical protein